ncbi:hypothetical protein SLE2022_233300 [Rubroshorea leprosula]
MRYSSWHVKLCTSQMQNENSNSKKATKKEAKACGGDAGRWMLEDILKLRGFYLSSSWDQNKSKACFSRVSSKGMG